MVRPPAAATQVRIAGMRRGARARIGLVVFSAGAATFASVSSGWAAPLLDITPPSDCGVVVNHAPTGNLTKAFFSFLDNTDGTATYSYHVTSTRSQSSITNPNSQLEDCAYTGTSPNSNPGPPPPAPSQIKYGTQSGTPPPFNSNSQTTVTLTVAITDWICDRLHLVVTDTSGNVVADDYSNLVGARTTPTGGTGDDSICQQSAIVPEAPATGLIAAVGLGAFAAVWFVGRQRRRRGLLA